MTTILPIYVFLIAILIVAVRSITSHTDYMTPDKHITQDHQKEVTGVLYVYPRTPFVPTHRELRRAQERHIQVSHTRTKEDIQAWVQNTREIDKLRKRLAIH